MSGNTMQNEIQAVWKYFNFPDALKFLKWMGNEVLQTTLILYMSTQHPLCIVK